MEIKLLTDEQLIQEYIPLIKTVMNKILNGFYEKLPVVIDKEDLIQVGCIALISARKNFKEIGNATFETYAFASIKYTMIREINKIRGGGSYHYKIIPNFSSLDTIINDNGDPLYSVIPDPSPPFINELEIDDIINRLDNDRWKKILKLYFWSDLREPEIAKIIGISAINVNKNKNKAIDKLREVFGQKESLGIKMLGSGWYKMPDGRKVRKAEMLKLKAEMEIPLKGIRKIGRGWYQLPNRKKVRKSELSQEDLKQLIN